MARMEGDPGATDQDARDPYAGTQGSIGRRKQGDHEDHESSEDVGDDHACDKGDRRQDGERSKLGRSTSQAVAEEQERDCAHERRRKSLGGDQQPHLRTRRTKDIGGDAVGHGPRAAHLLRILGGQVRSTARRGRKWCRRRYWRRSLKMELFEREADRHSAALVISSAVLEVAGPTVNKQRPKEQEAADERRQQ